MAQTKVFRHSFAGGEVSPEMESRIDDARHQQGLSLCRNMLVHPQGNSERRRGSEFVAEAANVATGLSRLIPFEFSADQQLVIEIAAGKFRFHVDGAPLLGDASQFVPSRMIQTATLATDTLTTNVAHGLTTGDAITFVTTPGSSLTQPLALYTTYYAIVTATNQLKVATTRARALAGTAIDLTLAGSGSLTSAVCRVYEAGESCAGFGGPFVCTLLSRSGNPTIAGPAITITSIASSTITTSGAHSLFPGSQVTFALNGGTVPAEITPGAVYYAIPITATTFRIGTDYGVAPISLTGGITGSPTVALHAPFAVLTDGIYEVSNSYAQAHLRELKYAQRQDVVRITHPSYPESELRRLGPTHWQFAPVTYGAEIDVPAPGATTTNIGEWFAATGVDAANTTGGYISFIKTDHLLTVGDVVLWDGGGTVTDAVAGTSYDGNGSVFIVAALTNTDGSEFALKDIAGVAVGIAGSNHAITGTIRFRKTSMLAPSSHKYQVTAVDGDGRETLPSSTITVTNRLDVHGAQNTITWGAVDGAVRYRVYKDRNGVFGFLGEVDHVAGTATFSFTDDTTYTVDMALTAPKLDESVGGADYARCSAFFEERWWVGGLRSLSQTLFATRTGTLGDWTFHVPTQATDRIQQTIADTEAVTIRHLVPLGHLLVLTNSGEHRVTSGSGGPIKPDDMTQRRQSSVGCSDVTPVVVNNTVLFAAARNGHLWELGYQEQAGGYVPGDVCLRAAHLFDGFDVVDLAYAKGRLQSAWAVSSSGKLLGLSYLPAEQVGAWHRHDTDGAFESGCVIVESDGSEALYLCVQRTVNGNDVHYIERIRLTAPPTAIEDSFYVDCGLSYTNPGPSEATVITGLDHLEGETVTALSDGTVHKGLVVASGSITLPAPLAAGKTLHVGLPMTSEIQTLPLVLGVDNAFGQGRTKNVTRIAAKVRRSARFKSGPDENRLVESGEIAVGALADGLVRVLQIGSWRDGGQVIVRQDDPLPLNLVSLVLEVSYGGP